MSAGLKTLVRSCSFPTSIVSGSRLFLVGEEVRIYIIVVIAVGRETFRDLMGFLLLSSGGQVNICEFVGFHRSQCTYTEQNFDHT